MALTGSEILQVQGVQSNGMPSGQTFPTTTLAIAGLASTGSSGNVITALNTVGAGTITAAGIFGKITKRGGAQSATPFTDTTDTAVAIIAAMPSGASIGNAFKYVYANNTNAAATITGGVGVTVSGITLVPANSWVEYLVTYTAAATITLVGYEAGAFPIGGTFTANGVTQVTIADTNVSASSSIDITLKTVGGTVSPSVPYINTITPGTGFTIKATAADTSVYNYLITG